ncbi:MAG: chitobiase/beta-hexosaminidase C-terminal domain-containing protein [Bacteroidetes bacterium]|nr:chitobiase/beta-hexosaminidase C-terminal domain-containing protein [Bacteroidota bacterium]
MKKTITFFTSLIVMILMGMTVNAQITLSGSSYTQDFDGVGTGYPTGWMIKLHSTATSLGTDTVLTTTKTKWNLTNKGAYNYASADGLTATSDSAAQMSSTDRALGFRQTSTVGDPGVAFTMQIANTTNMNSFNLAFKLQSLDKTSPRKVTWLLQYATGAAPAVFTTVTTNPATIVTGDTAFTNTNVTANFGALLDNQAGPVWIRIVALTVSSAGGNRPTSAIDDVNLTWTNGVATTVAAPTFTPVAGTYYGPVSVSLSSSTAGAQIFYTTNGVDPTITDSLYTLPFTVAQTTTVKAIGIKTGLTNSSVSSSLYTIATPVVCATIADLRAKTADNSTVYELTGQVVLTCKVASRNQKFIQDATAAVLIDDATPIITTTYNVGDGITGIKGKLENYYNLLEFHPIANTSAATSTGNIIAPLTVTAANILDTTFMHNHQSKLIRLENISFTDANGTLKFGTGKKFKMTQGATTDSLFNCYFYDADYAATATAMIIPQGINTYINGIAVWNKSHYYITARNKADISLLNGINENEANTMGIYPNPSNGKFTVNVEKFSNGEIKIYSIVGSLILSQSINKANNEFDLSSNGKGLYFVQYTDNKSGKSWTEKLIVK